MELGLRKRSGLSSVISSILLSAAVLTVGGIMWNYANGASSVIASDYYEDSTELLTQLQERFLVEHVSNNSTHLTVYIYNYGDVDIEVDVYANEYNSDLNNPIPVETKSSANTTITMPCSSGDNIGIKIYSRRQNCVYHSYISK